MIIRRVDSIMLVRGASCICLRAPKREKNTGRRPILGLATRRDVLCNMLAERGANKSEGWGLGSFAAEWSILPAGGGLMRPKAETRSVLRRAVSSARTRKVSSMWCVPGDQQEGPKAETRSVLRRAVSSARSWKVSSVSYVPGDQQEGPLPSHCCCGRRCRRKGAPSIEKPPEKEQGLWARWKAKEKSLRQTAIGRIGRTLPQKQVWPKSRPCVRLLVGTQSVPCRSAN